MLTERSGEYGLFHGTVYPEPSALCVQKMCRGPFLL